MRPRLTSLILLVALSFGASGCTWLKRKKPQPAPAPVSAPPVTLPKPAEPKPPELPPPQVPQPVPHPVPEETPPVVVLPPPPHAPKQAPQKRRTPPRKTAAPKPEPQEAPAEPAPPQQPVPTPTKLGEMLSPEQAQQYEAALEQDLASARAALAELERRQLNEDQREAMSRVRSFVQQAEEARQSDLRTAAQLARRAALLGKDLLASTK